MGAPGNYPSCYSDAFLKLLIKTKNVPVTDVVGIHSNQIFFMIRHFLLCTMLSFIKCEFKPLICKNFSNKRTVVKSPAFCWRLKHFSAISSRLLSMAKAAKSPAFLK